MEGGRAGGGTVAEWEQTTVQVKCDFTPLV